jgi:WD40 repeat protein
VFLVGALIVAAVLAIAALFFAQQSNQNAEAAEENAVLAQEGQALAVTREAEALAQAEQRATAQALAEAAEQEALQQAAILLAAQAESELESGSADRAILLALAALENYPYTPQAEHALAQAISYNRALMLYEGHAGAVTGASWSRDGERVASSGTDNKVDSWDSSSGERLQVIELPDGITGNVHDWALAVKWAPDGQQLLSISGDRFLLGSQDYDLILWDISSGEQVRQVEIPNRAEPSGGQEATSLEHYTTGSGAAFAPVSGRLATVGGDNSAIIWDKSIGEQAAILTGHTAAVNSLDWSPDEEHIATASEDGTALIWSADEGDRLRELAGHDGPVNQIQWSPAGDRLATVGDDGTARLWGSSDGALEQVFDLEAGVLRTLSWSRDGSRLAVGADDGRIRILDAATGEVDTELIGHGSFVSFLEWSPVDDRLISGDRDGQVRVWNAAPSTAYLSLPYRGVLEPDWSSDGRYLVVPAGDWYRGAYPGNLAIWDISTGQPVAEHLAASDGRFWTRGQFSPDDRYLVVRGATASFLEPGWTDNSAYVLDAQVGKIIHTLTQGTEGSFTRATAWSPDGTKIATGMADFSEGSVAIWDFESGQRLRDLNCGEFVVKLTWSPDGEKLAAACTNATINEGKILVWDADSGEVLLSLTEPEAPAIFFSVSWSPDGSRLMTTGGNDQVGAPANPIRIFDAESGEELLVIDEHAGNIWWGSWSPDGRRIATGSSDGTTRIWDAATGAELLTLDTPNNWANSPEWSPDGRFLAIGLFSFDEDTESGVWRVWQSTEELLAYAKECCTFRELTAEERDQFGLQAQ